MLLRTPNQEPRSSPLVIKAGGQRYRETMQFLYLGGFIFANLGGFIFASTDMVVEIIRRIPLAWASYNRLKRELYCVV